MSALQLQAYKNTLKTTSTGRDLEAHVLTQAALKLTACLNNWDKAGHTERLNDALKRNQMLWTILQSELAVDDHPLPQKVREDLLNLSMFVDKRTFEVMAAPAPEKLAILININMNIAAGLRGSSGA